MKFKKKLKLSSNLAEIIGIMIGDGCLYLDKYNKYQTIVAFNKNESQHLYYVKKLFENYFKCYKFCITNIKSEFLLRNTSVFIGEQLIRFGLKPGNKIINKIIIPPWIFSKKLYLTKFIRGLFDTDGCVYRKYNNYAQIQIKLACEETVESIRKAFIILDFNPTKIQKDKYKQYVSWKFYLSRQYEIETFFKLIKPMNLKHRERYRKIKNGGIGI